MSFLKAWQRVTRPRVRAVVCIIPVGDDVMHTIPREDGASLNFSNAAKLCAAVDRFIAYLDMHLVRGGAARLVGGTITVSLSGAPLPALVFGQRALIIPLAHGEPATYASTAEEEARSVVVCIIDLGPQPMEKTADLEEHIVRTYEPERVGT